MKRALAGLVCFASGLVLGWVLPHGSKAGAGRPTLTVERPIDDWRREATRLRVVRTTGPDGDVDYAPGNDRPAWVVTTPGRTYYAVPE